MSSANPRANVTYDVFISCASEDYSLGQKVFDYLREKSVRAFFCEDALRRGGRAAFLKEIHQALAAARHLILILSAPEHAEKGHVEDEWMTFMGEVVAGRKKGNIICVLFGAITIDGLPLALRKYEVVRWEEDQKEHLLSYLPRTEQEIFRIDMRTKTIWWGRRPTTHRELSHVAEQNRVDGDKIGNVVHVWMSSYNEKQKKQCWEAARIIRSNEGTARQAGVVLAGATIEDNNGVVLHRFS